MYKIKTKAKQHVFLDLEQNYRLAFGNFALGQALDATWEVLFKEFAEEWRNLFIETEDDEDDDVLEDKEVLSYDWEFSSSDDFGDDVNLSLSAVSLDFEYDEENKFTESSTHIVDDFAFDEFFFEYYYIFIIFSFFFFPFFLFELLFFFSYLFYASHYVWYNTDEGDSAEDEMYGFLSSESDISHYDFAEFHFERFLSFDFMFNYSGFLKNKPYSKHIQLLKSIK